MPTCGWRIQSSVGMYPPPSRGYLWVLIRHPGRSYNVVLNRSFPPSAKVISVRAEWLRQGGRAPSQLWETPGWLITLRPASIPRVTLHIALGLPYRLCFWLCRSIRNSDSIFPTIWSHSLFIQFRRSTQLHGSLLAGSMIPFHPHSSLLEPGWLLIMAWRDREGWLNFVFLDDGRWDGTNHHEKLGLKRISCARQLTIPDQQVQVPIQHIITPIWGLPNPIRQVVPLISHIRADPPHRSHLHPPSLSCSSKSQPSSQNTKLSHPSLCLHGMIMSSHRVQHTPSTAYTEYSTERLFVFPSFSWLRVDPCMYLQLQACLLTQSTTISQHSMRAQR